MNQTRKWRALKQTSEISPSAHIEDDDDVELLEGRADE